MPVPAFPRGVLWMMLGMKSKLSYFIFDSRSYDSIIHILHNGKRPEPDSGQGQEGSRQREVVGRNRHYD
jgi:hypothetical protein